MKTNLLNLIAIVVLVFAAAACSKKKSSPAVATAPTTYTERNGYCYDSNNQQVAYSHCQNNNNSGYYISNNCCYRRSDNMQVDMSKCTGVGQQRCYGQHLWINPQSGQSYYVNCKDDNYGNNCSGYDMFNMQTQNWVYCQ